MNCYPVQVTRQLEHLVQESARNPAGQRIFAPQFASGLVQLLMPFGMATCRGVNGKGAMGLRVGR